MGMFNSRIEGGDGERVVVEPGQYLAFIRKVAPCTAKSSGNTGMRMNVVVRANGEKREVVFFTYYYRPAKGTKIAIGCATLQAIGRACGVSAPEDYDPPDVEGKVIGLDLEVEEDGTHPPKNVITSIYRTKQGGDGKPEIVPDPLWTLPGYEAPSEPASETQGGGDDDSDIPF